MSYEEYISRFLEAEARSLLKLFHYRHLPEHLQLVSQPFYGVAVSVAVAPYNYETIACLRKLLEAKDCAVRSFGLARGFVPPAAKEQQA